MNLLRLQICLFFAVLSYNKDIVINLYLNFTMSENLAYNSLESEIAELTRQIEDKRRTLEEESGIVREEKEMISETIADHFYDDTKALSPSASGQIDSATISAKPFSSNKDYLDSLSPEIIESVNTYVAMIPKDGIRKTISRVQSETPFIIDAFHDALVTRLYDELKERRIIK